MVVSATSGMTEAFPKQAYRKYEVWHMHKVRKTGLFRVAGAYILYRKKKPQIESGICQLKPCVVVCVAWM